MASKQRHLGHGVYILKITPMYTHFATKYIFKLEEYKSTDQKQLISNIKTTFQRTPKTL